MAIAGDWGSSLGSALQAIGGEEILLADGIGNDFDSITFIGSYTFKDSVIQRLQPVTIFQHQKRTASAIPVINCIIMRSILVKVFIFKV
jgi:hypothetical protein